MSILLGTNRDGNNWKYVIVNFLVIFLAQFIYESYEHIITVDRLPCAFQIYKMAIVSLVATLGFYGINRITHKAKNNASNN